MASPYDTRYAGPDFYWGLEPSSLCRRLLDQGPPTSPARLLEIGCGEGRDAVAFARAGYAVSAFDRSPMGVEKAKRLAREAGIEIELFTADLLSWRPEVRYEVVFSTGVLHYLLPELRDEALAAYRAVMPARRGAYGAKCVTRRRG